MSDPFTMEAWLKSIGMQRYIDIFIKTEKPLESMDVLLAHRLHILQRIHLLRSNSSNKKVNSKETAANPNTNTTIQITKEYIGIVSRILSNQSNLMTSYSSHSNANDLVMKQNLHKAISDSMNQLFKVLNDLLVFILIKNIHRPNRLWILLIGFVISKKYSYTEWIMNWWVVCRISESAAIENNVASKMRI